MALHLGGTISELQDKMTASEYSVWLAYRKKYGPLNPVRKYDLAAAQIASQVNKLRGGKGEPIDFMPYTQKQEEREATPEEFIAGLGPGVKIGR